MPATVCDSVVEGWRYACIILYKCSLVLPLRRPGGIRGLAHSRLAWEKVPILVCAHAAMPVAAALPRRIK